MTKSVRDDIIVMVVKEEVKILKQAESPACTKNRTR